jgi:phospholipid/cholesterol/gamma-HCH transport system permease protein
VKLSQVTERPIGDLGRFVLAVLHEFLTAIHQTGRILLLFWEVIVASVHPPIRWQLTLQQMRFIGVSSLFIVVLTGAFTGMVFALQSGRAFAMFGAETLTGATACLVIARELAPVFTALMVTARAGSAMAAQLGTMQVTQQIDALASMAVNPVHYLIVPRVLATILVAPILTAVFNFVGALGTYIVAVKVLEINEAIFVEKIRYYVEVSDIVQGLFKSVVFAAILSLVCCYKGYNARGGAAGVGLVTTQAVVISSVAILVSDYFLAALLF